jgi:hypothetical protein
VSEAEIHGGSNAVEEKLAGIGFGNDRIDVRQAAPDEGTPVETVQADEQPRNDLGQFASDGRSPQPESPEAPRTWRRHGRSRRVSAQQTARTRQ